MERTKSKHDLFLTLKGIPIEYSEEMPDFYFCYNPEGAWYPNKGNLMHEIESTCLSIHSSLAKKVFGNMKYYHDFLGSAPEFLYSAGMNSESTMTKEAFVHIVERLSSNSNVNKALYLYDCMKLVSGIQESNKEIIHLQGEFYQILNLEDFFYPQVQENDGTMFTTSPIVTKLFAMLGFIFIRMHSLLDYVTKLAVEIEGLKTEFDTYHKMISKKIMFSDKQRTSFNNKEGTLFEKCYLLTEIETIRNHLIHDGHLDDMPKAYKVIEGGVYVEKYILFPDQTPEGRFVTFKNRNLFYSNDQKINQKLPGIIQEFQRRLLSTLELFSENLASNPV